MNSQDDRQDRRPGNKRRNPSWQTWWSVVGPKLPHSETRLSERIVLAPISDEDFNANKKERIIPSLSTDFSHVAHYPPRDEVQSRYRLQVDVEASDADGAQKEAQGIADKLIASLSLTVLGGRYHAELRKLRRVDEKGEINPFSEPVTISPLDEPRNLEDSEIQAAHHVMFAIDTDKIAANAYSHLEPRRVYRRPFGLSYAAMAGASSMA